jgi:adenylate cyclase
MSRLTEIQKLKIKTILIITFLWMLFYSLIFIYEYSSIKIRFPDQFSKLNPEIEYGITMLFVLIIGLFGGSFFVFKVSFRARKRPFYYGLLLCVIYYMILYIPAIVINSIIFLIQRKVDLLPEVLGGMLKGLFTLLQLKNFLLLIFIIIITQFWIQVNDKFGPGNLWNTIIGKYFKPKEELRVFMFLDLRSSTSIAENLGHQRYYLFLNDFFALISDPIINRSGEIYQYVGDEVVVSWTAQKAIKNMNCLYCFFDIKAIIDKNKNIFIEKFGLVPDFKAGVHFGPITAGEVGVIKRDIVFTGDVLNTTSRIQSSCNTYKVDLLVSENTLALFDNLKPFDSVLIDKIELRGKENKISVFTLKVS